ncbi:MAG TPA: hypothetical protein VE084_24670, partial [Burkholderiaceae bacterium]|nr:hypothetical protein [Burkholderiaceae bacterium]
AANTFVTEGSQIDGSYAPLEINRAPTGEVGGGVISTRIMNGGTRMTTCMSSTPYTIETCPSGVLRTYTLQQNGDIWHATSTVNSRDQFDFSVALIGGERVYLTAGTFRDLMDLGGPERTGLRVGMPAINEDWPLSLGTGVSVGGSWGNYALDGLRLRATVADPWGQLRAVVTTVQASSVGYFLPNVRSLKSTDFAGYAIQNKSLFLAWGAPSGWQPALSVAQVAGVTPDKRTGSYLAFGFDGQLYSLQFDFGARTYAASREDGAPVGNGTMNSASAFAGYQLRDTAMTSPSSEAIVVAANDSVIGNLPLVDPSNGIVRRVPFVAVRNFVTQQRDLTVLPSMYAYWFSPDLGVANLPPVYQSIGPAGASMAICPWIPPDGAPSEPCPAQSVQTMVIAPGARPGAWRATRLDAPSGSGEDFYVARIGADYVYLSAANGMFKIGLDTSTSAPHWGTIATSGTQAAASSTLPSIYQNFGCFGSGVADCFRFFVYPMDAFRFNDAIPTGAPIRRATFASQPGTYTFHQGRNLLVMHGRTPSIVELGIGMAP